MTALSPLRSNHQDSSASIPTTGGYAALETIEPFGSALWPLPVTSVLQGLKRAAEVRPDRIALQSSAGAISFGVLEKRSNQLARGLLSRTPRVPRSIALLCCKKHTIDLIVGVLAAYKCGSHPFVLPADEPEWEATQTELRALAPRVVLVCEDASRAVLPSCGSFLVVGEGPAMIWWRVLEMRHSGAPVVGTTCTHVLPDFQTSPLVVSRRPQVVPFKVKDVVCALSLEHQDGRNVVLRSLRSGRTTTLLQPGDGFVPPSIDTGDVLIAPVTESTPAAA